jgi:hypothetical protein
VSRSRSINRMACSIGDVLAVTLVSAPGVAFAVAGTTGSASINLSKTVSTSKVSRVLSVSLGVDRSKAIPGDVVTYTATVSNTGTVLAVPGTFTAQNNGDATATVAAYWDDLEYLSSATAKWIPLAGFAAQQLGYGFVVPPPITTGMTLSSTPVPSTGVTYPGAGDRIFGTSIPWARRDPAGSEESAQHLRAGRPSSAPAGLPAVRGHLRGTGRPPSSVLRGVPRDRRPPAGCVVRQGWAGRPRQAASGRARSGERPEVRAKIGRSQSERRVLDLAWDADHPEGADPAVFEVLASAIRGIPLRVIAGATGLSVRAASDIRSGRPPHPRHWEALRSLIR